MEEIPERSAQDVLVFLEGLSLKETNLDETSVESLQAN
jgi:hypothetical protein